MKNIKKLMLVSLLMIGQNVFASDNSKAPSDRNLDAMKAERNLSAEVVAGSAAIFACSFSVAVALRNKGGATASSYIGCAALYTTLRQAVNVYKMDKQIEAAEIARKIASVEKKALELEQAKEKISMPSRTIEVKHTWGFGSSK